ncbi:MAG: hypothetical protein KZQ91_04185 [Candidatus Thiodiazotropha sp. (ex Lucinoma borealis)]|nr:hypothetical protein [Candidatus Thiodiazotropha sp. (ex Lucinoma borealis)]
MANDNNSASMDKALKHLQAFNEKLQQQSKWIDQPNHPELPTILDEYAKRDFWVLQEALNLLRGYHPHRSGWGESGDLALAKSCVGPGGSLSVINPQAPVRKWQVRPKDFIKWAEVKGLPLYPAMKHAMTSPVRLSSPTQQTRTSQANQTRKAEKEARLEALEWMRVEIDSRTIERNWDSSTIPATKEDFHDVFFRIFPDRDKVKVETLAADLPQIGIKFQPGRKKSKNNVLAKLFQG